jgi:hypothetical protein
MHGMTPEERFTTIENLLAALTESQVRNEAQIAAHNTAIEQQNAGIRDLIAASRTLVDAQMKTTAQIEAVTSNIDLLSQSQKELRDEMRETQKATEDKLHALIETVDRLIRSQQK